MAWLLRRGEVLASIELARSPGRRAVGLIGRKRLEGGFVIEPRRTIHSIGVRFPIDVAYLDRSGVVIGIARFRTHRIGRPRRHAHSVLAAEAGAFERWRLAIGDTLEIRE